MMLRFLLPIFIFFPLLASEDSWYSKIDTKIEAGMYMPLAGGTISNSSGSSDFRDDYGYENLRASYFSLLFLLDYDYVPNIEINYFILKDKQDIDLNKSVVVADGSFNSSVSTTLNYSVINLLLYQDFKQRGNYFYIFNSAYYIGDIEFDLGINIKQIDWKFKIRDMSDLTKTSSWISVKEFIPLPYIGVKYYLYNLTLYAGVSSLALTKAKATSYQATIEYRVIENLYLSAGYLYEQFRAVEELDSVEFKTSGYKVSFKYLF